MKEDELTLNALAQGTWAGGLQGQSIARIFFSQANSISMTNVLMFLMFETEG